MKRLLSLALAAVLLAGGGVAFASPQDGHGHGHGRGNDSQWDDDDGPGHGRGHNPKDEGRHDNGRHNGWYKKGERLPDRYYSRTYYVTDVVHQVQADGTYAQRFEARRNARDLTGDEPFAARRERGNES